MKSLSLFVSAAALLSASSAFALDCATLPTCESLGYKDKKAECPASKFLVCPFDGNMGKCMHDAAIGDLKYSLKTSNHDGWILCDGQSVSKTTYNSLFNVIGTNYGGSGDKFNVPDYRGYFLRAAETANDLSSYGGSPNSDMKKPQKEELPNIQGYLWADKEPDLRFTGMFKKYYHLASGRTLEWMYNNKKEGENGGQRVPATLPDELFKDKNGYSSYNKSYGPGNDGNAYLIDVNASLSNSIYKDNGHVIPANYAVNIFIYAGR